VRTQSDHDHLPVDRAADVFGEQRARAVEILVRELPEIAQVVAELEDVFGDPPGAQVVFAELARLTVHLLAKEQDEAHEQLLERIFAAVETVARASGVDLEETVAYAFLHGLGPRATDSASAYLGPVTEQVLAEMLDEGSAES
jgi:hypothetical protein